MTALRQFVSGFVIVWIIMIVIGLLILGAQRGTLHPAPEMVQRQAAWQAVGEQVDREAQEMERRAAIEAKVPPNMSNQVRP